MTRMAVLMLAASVMVSSTCCTSVLCRASACCAKVNATEGTQPEAVRVTYVCGEAASAVSEAVTRAILILVGHLNEHRDDDAPIPQAVFRLLGCEWVGSVDS